MNNIVEIRVRGIVQGVGFRPFVYRLAHERGLDGEVRNDTEGVRIRLTGAADAIRDLLRALEAAPPPLARIDDIEEHAFAGKLPPGLRILDSVADREENAVPTVSPDVATCWECLSEVLDPSNRRYRYPFTNCTNCGPRFSILCAVPYDRANTSMARFPMCTSCATEFSDAGSRRFHAQPNACPVCGPQLRLEAEGGTVISGEDPIRAAVTVLRKSAILAVKGLGGYHIACRALDERAVTELRRRKRRDAKPLALMARDLETIARYCLVSSEEARLLASASAPIVLLATSGSDRVAPSVAPRLRTLGFMLPYTPLHRLLLDAIGEPLVMTSGNRSDEPQVTQDDELWARLRGIADVALVHDRPIVNRVDDSVVRAVAGRARQVRRARGYAPAPLSMPPGFADAPEILALGAQLKATFCMLRRGRAMLSQHLGDLDDASSAEAYRRAIDGGLRLFDASPSAIAVDLHPGMVSTHLGETLAEVNSLPLIRVQHHHAHAAACLAENGVPCDAAPVLAVVLDGLGYGTDGTAWGGEFLLAGYAGFRRLGSLHPVAMPGGEQAIREPWRMAYAHLRRVLDRPALAGLFAPRYPTDLVGRMIEHQINSPMTTSCGRLFDAVAAVVGLCDRVGYEGQAAIELEARAEAEEIAYPFAITGPGDRGIVYLDPAPMWRRLVTDLRAGVDVGRLSMRFHHGLAAAIAEMVAHLADRHDDLWQGRVALSGGVFQNALLLRAAEERLRSIGCSVLSHAHVPSNDGGVALGQAVVAAAQTLERNG